MKIEHCRMMRCGQRLVTCFHLIPIMDNLYNVDENLTLTFDQLFGTFTEVYWNLVLKHGIRQQPVSERSNGTYLERALNATAMKYAITANIPFESISDEAKIEVCKKIKSKCKGTL